MSKTTKVKQKVSEELLKLIVPEEEQPYNVPKNWKWVKLKVIADIKGGKRLPKGHQLTDERTDFPYIRVSDFDNGSIDINSVKYINQDTASKIARYTISVEDVYISIAGTIGKTGIIPNMLDGAYLTENAAKITNIRASFNKFLYFYLNSPILMDQVNQSIVSTSQPKLALFRIENFNIALPPINEQKRITKRIEHLFSKIDQAKQLIEEVKESFELRRAAILEQAFKGNLNTSDTNGTNTPQSFYFISEKEFTTKEDQPYKVPDNWVWVKLGDIVQFINGDRGKGYPSKKDFIEHGIPFINAGHLEDGKIIMKAMNYISKEKYDLLRSGKVQNDDVLYCLRGTLGKSAIVRGFDIGAIASSLVILRPSDFVNSSFLYYYLISGLGKSMIEIYDNGTAQPNLSVNSVKKYLFPLPPIHEQAFIAEKINYLFDKLGKEKELVLDIEQKLDMLKSSILNKAFRGKLGTNDPTEENAIELLKEDIQSR